MVAGGGAEASVDCDDGDGGDGDKMTMVTEAVAMRQASCLRVEDGHPACAQNMLSASLAASATLVAAHM